MRITKEQAALRLMPNVSIGGARKAKGKATSSPISFVKMHGEKIYEFSMQGQNVLTPADDELPKILATYDSGNEMPPAMEDWLAMYDDEINWYQSTGKDLNLDIGGAVSPQDGMATIGALVRCKWHQKAPYNKDTVFNGDTCLTGCGATAIAQLLYYWGCQPHGGKLYRRGCMATSAYTSKTNRYKVAALPNISLFDYNNMSANKPTTEAQKNAIGQLMLYCGCAVKSDYAQGVTTSYLQDLQAGLRDYLRMGNPNIVQSSKGAALFERAILAELKEGRPVLLIGSGSQGGHFFLCDGYNPAENLYHMNWGWGGSYDGWFAMSALNPSKYSFNSSKKAIVGIKPAYVWGDVNGDGIVSVTDAMLVQQQILKGGKTEAADVNNDGSVDVADAMTIVKHTLKD